MSFKTELANIALIEINKRTKLYFEDFTAEYDLSDTAATDYDGVILQIYFPNPAAGFPQFRMVKTDITAKEVTTYFKNEEGGNDLTFHQVIILINTYISQVNEAYNNKKNKPK